MGSLLRRVKERKKTRRLGEVEVMEQEGYGELEVDSKVEMILALVPLGLMHVHELLDAEVSELAGERYVRKSETVQGRRHGTNPGTVKLAGQRVPIRVPRVRGRDGEIPLSSYESLSHRGEVDESASTKQCWYGISCRNYESAAELVPGAIGLSSSSVSRGFVEASAAKLREMQERDLRVRTWWRWSWTARRSPTRRWWWLSASRYPGTNASSASWTRQSTENRACS